MEPRDHWEHIYRTRRAEEVSWFQAHATLSRDLILSALSDRNATIVDAGGGASTLVDDLLEEGYRRVIVLDLARQALIQARQRLAEATRQASWVQADVLAPPFAPGSIALWHDRAVFHFLTTPADRLQYVDQVRQVVRSGGLVLVATFAADGPTECSGLAVARYDAAALHAAFGRGFQLIASHRQVHRTPAGRLQPFTYCLCRYVPDAHTHAVA